MKPYGFIQGLAPLLCAQAGIQSAGTSSNRLSMSSATRTMMTDRSDYTSQEGVERKFRPL